jgi:hypothetical protein
VHGLNTASLSKASKRWQEKHRQDGENGGWTIKLIIFVGGTCGSVHAQTFNNNLKELGVVELKKNTIRKGLVHELLNAQDTVLCSYFAQRSGERGEGRSRKSTV